MTTTCPFCKKTDIEDQALKCHHCGSWLEEKKRIDEYEAFRTSVDDKLKVDLDQHQKTMQGAFSTMKWVGGIVIVAVAGVSTYFGYRTDNSITEIATTLETQAKKQMEARVETISEVIIASVGTKMDERLKSVDVARQIDTAIDASLVDSVETEVKSRVSEVKAAVDAQVATATQELEATLNGLNARAEAALSETAATLQRVTAFEQEAQQVVSSVEGIQTQYSRAQDLQVGQSEGLLDFETVEVSAKGGLDELPDLIERRINALSFVMGGFYVPSISWKYLDWLTRLPEFQYVVLLDRDGSTALGYWDARALTAALNPPNQVDMSAEYGSDLFATPSDQELPGWIAFIRLLEGEATGPLEGLGAFRPARPALSEDDNNFEALALMETTGADSLPVLSPDGTLAGIVDRSRLTALMLLEIAGGER